MWHSDRIVKWGNFSRSLYIFYSIGFHYGHRQCDFLWHSSSSQIFDLIAAQNIKPAVSKFCGHKTKTSASYYFSPISKDVLQFMNINKDNKISVKFVWLCSAIQYFALKISAPATAFHICEKIMCCVVAVNDLWLRLPYGIRAQVKVNVCKGRALHPQTMSFFCPRTHFHCRFNSSHFFSLAISYGPTITNFKTPNQLIGHSFE